MLARALFGCLPDPVDVRDHAYAAPAALTALLPLRVDLRPRCPPVLHQGMLNACTAHAVASAHHFDQLKQGSSAPFPPSRLFIYWNERVKLGLQDQDSGATIRGGIKSLAKHGACPEALWAYDPASVLKPPPEACFEEARKSRAIAYKRIARDSVQIRACLAEGWPFAFGFDTYAEFHSPQVAQTGVLPLPGDGAQPVGSHAVLAVGYDTAQRTILAQNSWGADWGQGGCFTLPWEYLLEKHLARDFWTLRAVADSGAGA